MTKVKNKIPVYNLTEVRKLEIEEQELEDQSTPKQKLVLKLRIDVKSTKTIKRDDAIKDTKNVKCLFIESKINVDGKWRKKETRANVVMKAKILIVRAKNLFLYERILIAHRALNMDVSTLKEEFPAWHEGTIRRSVQNFYDKKYDFFPSSNVTELENKIDEMLRDTKG